MDLRNIIFVCGNTDLHNSVGNCPTKLFIDSQGCTGIDNFSMLHIKDIPHMIKDHNLVPNQKVSLGNIQQR